LIQHNYHLISSAQRFGYPAVVMTSLQSHNSTNFCKMPQHTLAEGGQGQAVVGRRAREAMAYNHTLDSNTV